MKNQIMDKIVKEMENVGKIPRSIIKFGSILSLLLFLGAAFAFAVNNHYFNSFDVMYNSIAMMKTSVTVFAEIIIGALVIDHLSKSNLS